MPRRIGLFNIISIDKGESPNSCKDCTACCTTLSIDEDDFHKPPNVRCQHLTDGGCSIYSTKPSLCSSYYCMYAINKDTREDERPNKLGILFSMSDADSHFTSTTGLPLIAAYEIVKDSFKTYNGDRVLRRYSKKIIVALIPNHKLVELERMIDDTTVFLGPNKYRDTLSKYLLTAKAHIASRRRKESEVK